MFHIIVVIALFASEVSSWKTGLRRATSGAVVAFGLSILNVNVESSLAVSGGGKDFANKDLRDGEVKLEGGKFVGKDFTQVLANDVSFKGANLQGVRFYKANLNKADFSGANLATASLEDAGLEGTIFDDANLAGAYISSSFEQVGSIKNADFTDALIPSKTQANLCSRPDVGGTNTKSGVSTSESLMCP